MLSCQVFGRRCVVVFLLILAVSQQRFFCGFFVIYSVLLYIMRFLEVPDVSCIWSVVTICLCVRFHNIISLAHKVLKCQWAGYPGKG